MSLYFHLIKQSDWIPTNFNENKTRPAAILVLYCSLSVSSPVPLGLFICSSSPESNGCSLLTLWVGAVISRSENFRTELDSKGFWMLWVILSSYPNSFCSDGMRAPNRLVVNCNVSVVHVGLAVLPLWDESPWFTLNLRCYISIQKTIFLLFIIY